MYTETIDKLCENARLTGRIELLIEIKEWLDEQIVEARIAHDRLAAEVVEVSEVQQ